MPDSFIQDLRYGFRLFIKSPSFTCGAILALALGTGANSALFSVVNGILIQPLPYSDPDRLLMIFGNNLKSNTPRAAISLPDFNDLRAQNKLLEQIAGFSYDDFVLTGGDRPLSLRGEMVSANFFSTLGVSPFRGRFFRPEEDQAGSERVAVISYELWQRQFGADEGVVGRSVQLNGASFSVIGITPPRFRSPAETVDDVWVPISSAGDDKLRVPSIVASEDLADRSRRFLYCIGRLKPGVDRAAGQAELETIASRLEEQYPDKNNGFNVSIIPMHKHIVGDITARLVIPMCAAGVLLLIACGNVASLLIARAATRQKEIAVRAALGAGRFRLLRQLLTESLLLSLTGGALGLVFAFVGIRLLKVINPQNIPRLNEIEIDGTVLGVTILISVLTGLVFGLAPALQGSKADLAEELKEGARGTSGGVLQLRLRSVIVVMEIAMAEVLLIAAGLVGKSFWSLQNVNPGFDRQNVLTMQVTLPSFKYTEDYQIAAFFDQVLSRTSVLPGVESAAASSTLPLGTDDITFRFTVDGRAPATTNEQLRASLKSVSADYFTAMRIRLVRGRFFTNQDHEKSAPVVIVNESMARRYWPDGDPIERYITIPGLGGISRKVVGIVADVKRTRLDTESGTEMYLPYLQKPWNFMALVVRTTADPLLLSEPIRKEILNVDGNQPVFDVKPMEQIVSDSLSQTKLTAVLVAVFAGIALALTVIGVYGVISYVVNQRRREIGIRMALGARVSDIMSMVVGKGLVLTAGGLAIGWIAAFLSSFLLSDMLFQVSERDLTTFTLAPLLVGLVALFSTYIPARKATAVNPAAALRVE